MNNQETVNIKVPREVAATLEEEAVRNGTTLAEASRMLLRHSSVDLSRLTGDIFAAVDVALYAAAYAAVVAAELALRGLDPEREKTLIADARRAYRMAADQRVKFFRKIRGEHEKSKR
jgi:hypothetical protein